MNNEISIFDNKFSLALLILIIFSGLIYVGYQYKLKSDYIVNLRSQVNIGGEVKTITKIDFFEKMSSRGTTDIITTLNSISQWNVSICEVGVCETFLKILGPLTYQTNSIIEREEFKSHIVNRFKVSETQFESYYPSITDTKLEFLFKTRYFVKEFYDLKLFQDDENYYLVIIENYLKKSDSAPRKQELVDTLEKSFKWLWESTTLETKLYIQDFLSYKDQIKNNYIYSLLWKFPKNVLSDNIQAKKFILTYTTDPLVAQRAKDAITLDKIWTSSVTLKNLNNELNTLFIKTNITQIFEKYDILKQDKSLTPTSSWSTTK